MKRKKHSSGSSSSSSSPYLSSDSDDHQLSSPRRHRKRTHGNKKKHRDERRQHRRKKEKSRERRKSGETRERERSKRHRSRRREAKRKFSDSGSDSEYGSDLGVERVENTSPEAVVRDILNQFPDVAADLEQLLQMIDNGQAVDIRGLSEKSLIKHLRKLFLSLDLKESGKHIFLLPPNVQPTLNLVGPLIRGCDNDSQSAPPETESKEGITNNNSTTLCPDEGAAVLRRRVIGPEMPSAELLAAAAKLTEAEAELREAELDEDNEIFIGPPPPAVVTEAESANEAERLEEVTRILGAEVGSPYDVLGVNRNMSAENIKKRYWKLSLIVHPDKCSHPQAHQAFIKLNKSFKDLQDPDKRKALDEKIKQKEEQEEFKAELQAMREAAQWRRLQGISMEGDDVLLADMDVKVGPKRDEWMTTLPPERKPGMTMQSTRFSRTAKEGRGDTSVWTDTLSDRAQKAKMNYLEAYNETAALASSKQETKRKNSDADLVDQYNKEKRSKSLVEKHQEAARSHLKKKAKLEPAKEEWEGKHPWKPWDREKDLTAGRKGFNFDADNMSEGLSSRFSSGSFQRNFL